jgi:hypothetical protein
VVGFYPTIATDFEDRFEMKSPFTILYHYWGELEAYLGSNLDDKTRMHLNLHLEYMQGKLGHSKSQNESMVKRGFVACKCLWTIFKPGEIQYLSHYGHPRLLKLTKTAYDQSGCLGPFLEVHCSFVEYDGTSSTQANHVIRIREKTVFGLGNAAKITGLAISP